MTRFRTLLTALALALPALPACLASHEELAFPVDAELSSATLADDCPEAGAPREAFYTSAG